MLVAWHVLADAATQRYKQQLLVATLAIAGVLLVAALVLAWVRRLNQRKPSIKLSSSEQLAEFRVLYERGELSSEEFHRLKTILSERIREELAEQAPSPEVTEAGLSTKMAKPKDSGTSGNNGAPGG
jgi:hypothetical protein